MTGCTTGQTVRVTAWRAALQRPAVALLLVLAGTLPACTEPIKENPSSEPIKGQ
jgi:hypothetical protein